MATVTFVLGLCGSGKSYLVDAMTGVEKFQESFFDHKDEFLAAVQAGADCVVSELAFLRAKPREEILREILAIAPDAKIKWVCFENDLEQANRNCRRERKDKLPGSEEDHVAINYAHRPHYTYPEGAEIIPVRRPGEAKKEST
jgi:hypothetical protein